MYCYTIENRIRRNRFKMYGFFKNGKVNKELDEIIRKHIVEEKGDSLICPYIKKG